MDETTRIDRGRSFDTVASTYDQVRPSYPSQIVSTLFEVCELAPESRVLEIGAGSGKATEFLAGHNLELTCIEPGPALAKILQQRFAADAKFSVQVFTFEEFNAAPQSFDCLVAAQAFHWLRPEDRLARSHRLLRTSGSLAMLWNMSPRSDTEFFRELYAVYDRLADGIREPSFIDCAPEKVVVTSGEEMKSCRLFRDVQVHRVAWNAIYNGPAFLRLLDTYSNHRALDQVLRTRLFSAVEELCAAFKNTITKEYVAVLYTGKAC